MNIEDYSKRKVICINNKDNEFFGCDENSPLLEVHIQLDGLVHPSTTALLHPPPILEGGVHQCIRRNGGNGIVPILNLGGIEGDFLHDAIGGTIRKLNPVTDAKHIIGRKLDTGHKSQNRILEDEHQDSCRSSQTGKESRRRLVDKYRHDEDASHKEEQYLEDLHQTFHRPASAFSFGIIKIEHCQEKGIDGK